MPKIPSSQRGLFAVATGLSGRSLSWGASMSAAWRNVLRNALIGGLYCWGALILFGATDPGDWNDAPADAVVVFNEVMYHPAEGAVGSSEWVELHNQMSVDIDLSSWRLTGGVDFLFPPGTVIPRGGYLVVAQDPGALSAANHLEGVFGPWTGRLNNAGDTITLRNHNGRLMDQLKFGDAPPWPVAPDGSGVSLAKIRRLTTSGPSEHWRGSSQVGGTPGSVNFPDLEGDPPVNRILISSASSAEWNVPISESEDATWFENGSSTSTSEWRVGTASVGLDRSVAAGARVLAPDRYWPLDGNFQDASGHGYDGTPEGVGWTNQVPPVPGKQTSADFPGTSQYIQVNDGVDPTEYTIAAWIRLDSTKAASVVVRTSGAGPTGAWSHQLRVVSGGRLEHYVFDGTSRVLRGTNVLQRGRWYHVAATARNNGFMRLYVNGVQDSTNRSMGVLWTDGDQWRIGSNSGDDRGYFDGQISDLAIWHQELTSAEVLRLSSLSSPALASGFRGLFGTDVEAAMGMDKSAVRVRVPFVMEEGAGFDQMSLSLQYADGYVAWLNGMEVVRGNAPLTGVPAWNAVATDSRADLDAVRPEVIDLTSKLGLLRPGTNLFAIQVMGRSAGESNLLMAPQLRAREVVRRSDLVALNFHEVTSGALGGAFWFELWNHGDSELDLEGVRIGDGQGRWFRLGAGRLAPGGYRVVDEFELGFRPLVGSRLFLMSASGRELLDALFVTGLPQARKESDPRGEWFRPVALSRGAANRFQWEEDIVINEIMYHHRPDYPKRAVPPVYTNTVVLPFDSEWRYDASSIFEDDGWKATGYDDSGWARGLATLGTGSGTLPVALKTPIAGNGRMTFYFRTTFSMPQLQGPYDLMMTAFLDDGALVYLNGREVFRHNLPAGLITYTNRALTNISQNALLVPVKLPLDALVPGQNFLAVELHQSLANAGADFLMAIRLHAAQLLEPGLEGEPYRENPEEWIELYHRGTVRKNLGGWRLSDSVRHTFAPDTWIEPGGYLVVAKDAVAFHGKHPGVAVAGEFDGTLSNRGDRVRLLDALGNPADEVRYFTERPWPEASDGNGSSLELKDARSDNSVPEAWAASDEAKESGWARYEIRGIANTPLYTPAQSGFHELRFCLLDAGEVLVDRVSVTEDPGFLPRELIQNAGFDAGAAKWRMTGNHIRSGVVDDPDHPGNRVFRIWSTGPGSYLNNLVETSLKFGNALVPVVNGKEYRISFDAKWISGTPLLRAELYYNKLAGTVRLEQPALHGTPGRRNSRQVDNMGPTFRCMSHSPVAPKPGEAITVQVQAEDPDGIESMALRYSLNGGRAWSEIAMQRDADQFYRGSLPVQTNAAQFQFYVVGRDFRQAESFYPAGGTNSRALIRVQATLAARPKVPVMRIWMDSREALGLMPMTNLVSDDSVLCTIVLDDREVFYDSGARLHGSMHSRQTQESAGFNVRFPGDQAYRGVRTSFILRRRDHVEILCRHMLVNGWDMPANYDDFLYLVSPLPGNVGIARVILGNDDSSFLRSTFEDGDQAQVFKMEGIREFQTTDTGGPEGYKVAMPIGWVQTFDITDLGDNPDQYRWSTLISNHRDRDDYSRYIAMAKTFRLTGDALKVAVEPVMDVDEWARLFSLQSLCGVADVYTVENPHNLGYVVRPKDGRVLALQNDWSFPFNVGSTTPLIGIQNLSKIFNLPVYKRLYWGNVLEWINTTYDPAYMQRWARHYEEVTGESMRSGLDYMPARRAYARSQLPKAVPFAITTGGGLDFATNSSVIRIEGTGWIDVANVTVNGPTNRLEVEWLDGQRWASLVALSAGTNRIQLQAWDRRGRLVGEDEITVTATVTDHPQRDFLRIVEILYQPSGPTEMERGAGIDDGDQFEFLEIMNVGPVPVSLRGVHFDAGIQFSFGSASQAQLGAGQRAILVRDRAAFQYRFPDAGPILGVYQGSLNNGGELLRWVDEAGLVIQEIRYREDGDWPAKAGEEGRSLVLLDADAPASLGSSWGASTLPGGTPGVSEPVSLGLAAAGLEGGRVQLRVQLPEGGPYLLQWRGDLNRGGSEWRELQAFPPSPAARARTLILEPDGTVPQRFFRLATP